FGRSTGNRAAQPPVEAGVMSSSGVHRSQTADQPLLRGWSHVVAAGAAAIFAVVILPHAVGSSLQLTTLSLYCLTLVWLFGCSALYNIVPWSPSRLKLLRAIDHSNIYVVIAATSTAISANVLDGWQRLLPLVAVWVFALVGVTVTITHVR